MHKLKNLVLFLTIVGMVIFMPFPALADDASVVDTGDTTLIIICGALVFFMTPALGLFYAGMVSKKNALNTIMSSLVLIGIITVEWVAFGYSAAFGEDFFGIIGKPEFIGLAGVGTTPNADYAPTIPHILFAVYNMMYAIITPAIASGAIVERARFGPYGFLCFSGGYWSTMPCAIWSGEWAVSCGAWAHWTLQEARSCISHQE